MFTVRDLRFAWLLVGATACWGIATAVSKSALSAFDPLVLLVVQLSASSLFVAVALLVRRESVPRTGQTTRLALLGLLNPGLAYALSLAGLTSISASLSVLLWAGEPILILALAVLVFRDRVTPVMALLMLAAFTGVLLIIGQRGGGASTGIALTLAGVACCALYTVLCRRLLLDDATLPVVLVQQLAALGFAVVLAAAFAVTSHLAIPNSVPTGSWLAALGSGIAYYAVAFWFYLAGLRRVPAAVAGSFINLIPVFGVTAGYLLLDERLTPRQLAGAAIVLTAVTLLALHSTRDSQSSTTTPHDTPSQASTAH
jgi:drug/metabolite transporter (DMT)-like permease